MDDALQLLLDYGDDYKDIDDDDDDNNDDDNDNNDDGGDVTPVLSKEIVIESDEDFEEFIYEDYKDIDNEFAGSTQTKDGVFFREEPEFYQENGDTLKGHFSKVVIIGDTRIRHATKHGTNEYKARPFIISKRTLKFSDLEGLIENYVVQTANDKILFVISCGIHDILNMADVDDLQCIPAFHKPLWRYKLPNYDHVKITDEIIGKMHKFKKKISNKSTHVVFTNLIGVDLEQFQKVQYKQMFGQEQCSMCALSESTLNQDNKKVMHALYKINIRIKSEGLSTCISKLMKWNILQYQNEMISVSSNLTKVNYLIDGLNLNDSAQKMVSQKLAILCCEYTSLLKQESKSAASFKKGKSRFNSPIRDRDHSRDSGTREKKHIDGDSGTREKKHIDGDSGTREKKHIDSDSGTREKKHIDGDRDHRRRHDLIKDSRERNEKGQNRERERDDEKDHKKEREKHNEKNHNRERESHDERDENRENHYDNKKKEKDNNVDNNQTNNLSTSASYKNTNYNYNEAQWYLDPSLSIEKAIRVYKRVIICGDYWLQPVCDDWPKSDPIKPTFAILNQIGVEEIVKKLEVKYDLSNTLFVLGVGARDVLQYVRHPDCHGHKPLVYPTVTSELLDSFASFAGKLWATMYNLKKKILGTYYGSQVIYMTVYPMYLFLYQNSLIDKHEKNTGHRITKPLMSEIMISKATRNLPLLFEQINMWINENCQKDMLPTWGINRIVNTKGSEKNVVFPENEIKQSVSSKIVIKFKKLIELANPIDDLAMNELKHRETGSALGESSGMEMFPVIQKPIPIKGQPRSMRSVESSDSKPKSPVRRVRKGERERERSRDRSPIMRKRSRERSPVLLRRRSRERSPVLLRRRSRERSPVMKRRSRERSHMRTQVREMSPSLGRSDKCIRPNQIKYEEGFLKLSQDHDKYCAQYYQHPQRHPDYDNEKRIFMDIHSMRKYNLGQSEDLQREWELFWPTKMKQILRADWEKKKTRLLRPDRHSSNSRREEEKHVKSYDKPKKIESSFGKSSPINQGSRGARNDSSSLTMKTLKLLEATKDSLGKLAMPISLWYDKAISIEAAGNDPITIFDQDGKTLLQMISSRLKIALDEASVVQKVIIEASLDKLRELIDSLCCENEESIAKSTIGQNDIDILEFIQNQFIYLGQKNVSHDKLKSVFVKVKSLHASYKKSTNTPLPNSYNQTNILQRPLPNYSQNNDSYGKPMMHHSAYGNPSSSIDIASPMSGLPPITSQLSGIPTSTSHHSEYLRMPYGVSEMPANNCKIDLGNQNQPGPPMPSFYSDPPSAPSSTFANLNKQPPSSENTSSSQNYYSAQEMFNKFSTFSQLHVGERQKLLGCLSDIESKNNLLAQELKRLMNDSFR